MYQPPTPITPATKAGKIEEVTINATIGVESESAFILARVSAESNERRRARSSVEGCHHGEERALTGYTYDFSTL